MGLLIAVLAWLVALFSGMKLLFLTHGAGALFALCLMFQIFVRSMSETLFVEPGSSSMFWFALTFGCLERLRTRYAKPIALPEFRAPKMSYGRDLAG